MAHVCGRRFDGWFPLFPYTPELIGNVTSSADHGKVMASEATTRIAASAAPAARAMPVRAVEHLKEDSKAPGAPRSQRHGRACGLPTTTCRSASAQDWSRAPAAREVALVNRAHIATIWA